VLPREAPEEKLRRKDLRRRSTVLPREAPEEKLRRKDLREAPEEGPPEKGPPEKHVVLKTSQVLSFRSTIKRRRRGSCAI